MSQNKPSNAEHLYSRWQYVTELVTTRDYWQHSELSPHLSYKNFNSNNLTPILDRTIDLYAAGTGLHRYDIWDVLELIDPIICLQCAPVIKWATIAMCPTAANKYLENKLNP